MVEPLYVAKYFQFSDFPVWEFPLVDQFTFQCFKEAFRYRIVPAIAFSAHALGYIVFGSSGLELATYILGTPVKVENQAFFHPSLCNSHFHSFYTRMLCGHIAAERPAYTAWWLMANLQGEGGKVSQAYIDSRVTLQNQILQRMRGLGISPVLQGYYGMVPANFGTKVPAATINPQGDWGGYNRPPVLTGSVTDQIATYWYQELTTLFGQSDFYGGDVFHEGGIVPNGLDLKAYATQLQTAMHNANPAATWVLQAWQSNPKTNFLKGLKKDQVLILDYSNDVYGFWKNRNGFDGYPWVYGVINNFGGRMGIYGRLQKIADDIYTMQNSANKGNNVGIGIAPEAIVYNQVSYDLMWDLAWETSQVNTANWIDKFADKRYGLNLDNARKSWGVLNSTALNSNAGVEGATESIFNIRPNFSYTNPAVSCCSNTAAYYNFADLLPAWTHLYNSIDVLKHQATFKHDLVDLSRQIISNYGKDIYLSMKDAVSNADKPTFIQKSNIFLSLMSDQDSLLRTNEEYLLGKWIDDARKMGNSPSESDLFELNARSLPTTWTTSFKSGILQNYAHHEWAGLTKDFFRARWKIYIDKMIASDLNTTTSETDFYSTFDRPWTQLKGNGYDVTANGKEIEMAQYIYAKYLNNMGYSLSNNSPVVPYQSFNITKYATLNSTIGKVKATDADVSQTLSYSIFSQPVAGAVSIDGATGKLSLSNTSILTSTPQNTYKIIVRVEDNGSPSYAVYREIIITIGSKNGPGGVSKADGKSSLKTWLKASDIDDNLTNNPASGTVVLQWKDKSGYSNNYTSVISSAPEFDSNGAISAVNFNGATAQKLTASLPTVLPTSTAYLVANLTKVNDSQVLLDDSYTSILSEADASTGKFGYNVKPNTNFTSSLNSTFGSISILSFNKKQYDDKIGFNAGYTSSLLSGVDPNVNLPLLNIGNLDNSSRLNGNLYEILFFDAALNDAEKIILENYLSATYGSQIALKSYQQDLLANGAYKYNVAGIGRVNDSNAQLNARGSGILEISNPQNLRDDKFLIWGDNGAQNTFELSADLPAGVDAKFAKEWRVNEVNAAGNSAVDVGAIDLMVDLSSVGSVINASDLALIVDTNNDGLYGNETAIFGATDLGSNQFLFTGLTQVANNLRFTLAQKNVTLSVNYSDFEVVNIKDKAAQLNWKTKSEPNNRLFELYRSKDATEWTSFARVESKSPNGANYTFLDEKPFLGISYYQIKQIDLDGQSTLSPIKTVNLKSLDIKKLRLYPSPSKDFVFLSSDEPISKNTFSIIDVSGHNITPLVKIQQINKTNLKIDIQKLSPAVYFIKTNEQHLKFIKQ